MKRKLMNRKYIRYKDETVYTLYYRGNHTIYYNLLADQRAKITILI